MVDPERLSALLLRLAEERRELQGLAELDERIGLDTNELAAAKYRFIVATEVCIDIGQHIISSEGLKVADSYAHVFDVLCEGGFLPGDLAGDLHNMAGFRNLLVHGYAVVDDSRVREILRTRLGDFEAFRRVIAPLAGLSD
jgi:uncharacterized protein YutE (UPF0331/DUF86 family)